MGGVFGHMSHLYDNPNLKFSQIKDIFQKAAAGELEGTEKTDGQNLFVSYDIRDGVVRAARNKGNIKDGGLTPEKLAAKFVDRGSLSETFVDAFEAFALAVERMPDDLKLELFGPEANIYYNAEIQDPRSANIINYDVKTLNIHRTGHAEYDKKTGKPIRDVSGNAAILEKYLSRAENNLKKTDYLVQVNAIRNLEKLTNDAALDEALIRLERFTSKHGLSDNNTVGEYLVKALDLQVSAELPDLPIEAKKLLMKRMFEEGYGTEEVEGKKQRKVTVKAIVGALDHPEQGPPAKALVKKAPAIIKVLIYPLEDIVHDFSVEMLKGLHSAFLLDSEAEIVRQRKEVASAIQAIEASNNEEAMEILQQQMKKLKNVESISTAAEGFVFDYDGHTYKFTGNFAPVNQLLGLFKYGRGSVPPLKPLDASEVLSEAFTHKGNEFLFIPGGFKPPHKGHIHLIAKATEKVPKAKPYLVTGETPRDSVTLQQSMDVLRLLLQRAEGLNLDDLSIITIPKGGLVVLDEDGQPLLNNSGETRFSNSPLQGIYNSALGLPKGATVYIASSTADKQHGDIGKSIKKARPDLSVKALQISPLQGTKEGEKMSASEMRRALLDGDLESFKTFLPDEAQKQAEYIFTRILRGETKEQPEEGAPLAESFRAGDLYGLIDEMIEEMSSMAGGSVQGGMIGTGSKKGPWADLDVEAENEKQKKNQKLKGDKEELVGEILNYLLNKEAPL